MVVDTGPQVDSGSETTPAAVPLVDEIILCIATVGLSDDVVWWQNGDLGLGWVLEYIQRFIVDSGRWDPTDHKSD